MFVFISCEKEELPLSAPQPGNIETKIIEIGYPYLYQVYYDCGSNSVVSTNTKYDWDLALESSPEGYHIMLNTAKGMLISNEGGKSFAQVNTLDGVKWLWDSSTGNLDSTAIGNWRLNMEQVYILDRMYDVNGNHLGYVKMQLLEVTETQYKIRTANLDGTQEQEFIIAKDVDRNFVHFTFDNGGTTVDIEPPKEEWDLLFTNYQHFFTNLPLPFVITGVYSNRFNDVVVGESSKGDFLNVELADTSLFEYQKRQDAIGYDWKIRNSSDNSFTIDANKYFVVKTTEGLFYKIRFIEFYNEQGEKGYPKFEIQKL